MWGSLGCVAVRVHMGGEGRSLASEDPPPLGVEGPSSTPPLGERRRNGKVLGPSGVWFPKPGVPDFLRCPSPPSPRECIPPTGCRRGPDTYDMKSKPSELIPPDARTGPPGSGGRVLLGHAGCEPLSAGRPKRGECIPISSGFNCGRRGGFRASPKFPERRETRGIGYPPPLLPHRLILMRIITHEVLRF